MTRKIVSEMTYNVSMETLNPTIPYLIICQNNVNCLMWLWIALCGFGLVLETVENRQQVFLLVLVLLGLLVS